MIFKLFKFYITFVWFYFIFLFRASEVWTVTFTVGPPINADGTRTRRYLYGRDASQQMKFKAFAIALATGGTRSSATREGARPLESGDGGGQGTEHQVPWGNSARARRTAQATSYSSLGICIIIRPGRAGWPIDMDSYGFEVVCAKSPMQIIRATILNEATSGPRHGASNLERSSHDSSDRIGSDPSQPS